VIVVVVDLESLSYVFWAVDQRGSYQICLWVDRAKVGDGQSCWQVQSDYGLHAVRTHVLDWTSKWPPDVCKASAKRYLRAMNLLIS
jgi:hypothetical protein